MAGVAIRLAAVVLLALATALPVAPARAGGTVTLAAVEQPAVQPARPRVIVRPNKVRPGPNAKRYCRAKLVQEVRPSGTVIVPHTTCWWQ